MFEREDHTERFMIEPRGFDEGAVRLGVTWLLAWARKHGQPAAFATYAYQNWRRLQPILGRQIITALERDGTLLSLGVELRLITDRKSPGFFDGPILAIWLNDTQLRKVDELGASAICAIPWGEGNIDQWKAAWGPKDLLSGARAPTSTVSPVVEAALRDLTAAVNVGTGVTASDDRAAAVDLFRRLRNAGESYCADEVRAWASRNGWAPSDAQVLASIADRIAAGSRLRGGSHWREDAVDRWRRRAAS